MSRSALFAAAAVLLVSTSACDGMSLPGTNQVSASALKKASTDPRVREFYEARQWKPAWSGGAARDLKEAIKGSERHGIDADRFLAMIGQAPDKAREESALTLAAISYADALATGMADPRKVYGLYTLARPKVDIVAGLSKAVEDGNVGAWLDSLAPRDAEYKALSDEYVKVLQRIKETKAQPVPHGEAIKPGEKDPRMPLIVAALANAGFAAGPANPQATTYTAAMVPAIKGLQNEAGLKADGTIGDETVDALNSALSDHAQQLALNLEQRRWLARDVPATRIDVNTAAALLDYYKGGSLAYSARVVVGRPHNPTPQLGALMFQLVANPPWNVPQGIAEKEVLPKGPGFLASQGMVIEDGRVVQKPGPKAALGEVKFDLDDKYAIYLHDTPSKSAFETPFRHRSHGCVRVHHALDFARMLAREQGVLDAFDRKLASRDTGVVPLKDKIPVRLLYHTVFVDNAGKLVYLPDPYGWDAKLAKALGLKAPKRYNTEEDVGVELSP
ncbi:MAG TPA: L,D-transpeptidase family protein [Caulobacteraceae bacterium]